MSRSGLWRWLGALAWAALWAYLALIIGAHLAGRLIPHPPAEPHLRLDILIGWLNMYGRGQIGVTFTFAGLAFLLSLFLGAPWRREELYATRAGVRLLGPAREAAPAAPPATDLTTKAPRHQEDKKSDWVPSGLGGESAAPPPPPSFFAPLPAIPPPAVPVAPPPLPTGPLPVPAFAAAPIVPAAPAAPASILPLPDEARPPALSVAPPPPAVPSGPVRPVLPDEGLAAAPALPEPPTEDPAALLAPFSGRYTILDASRSDGAALELAGGTLAVYLEAAKGCFVTTRPAAPGAPEALLVGFAPAAGSVRRTASGLSASGEELLPAPGAPPERRGWMIELGLEGGALLAPPAGASLQLMIILGGADGGLTIWITALRQ